MSVMPTDYAIAVEVALAVLAFVRRVLHTARVIFTVTKRHVPTWLGALLTVCLFIPGPVDELFVVLVIVVMVAFKPAMRADLIASTRQAWHA